MKYMADPIRIQITQISIDSNKKPKIFSTLQAEIYGHLFDVKIGSISLADAVNFTKLRKDVELGINQSPIKILVNHDIIQNQIVTAVKSSEYILNTGDGINVKINESQIRSDINSAMQVAISNTDAQITLPEINLGEVFKNLEMPKSFPTDLQKIIDSLDKFTNAFENSGAKITKQTNNLKAYQSAIKDLKKSYLQNFESSLQYTDDKSAPEWKKAARLNTQSYNAINERLAELGATKEIRDSIAQSIKLEEERIRAAFENKQLKQMEADEQKELNAHLKEANRLLSDYQAKYKTYASLVGKEGTKEHATAYEQLDVARKRFEDFFNSVELREKDADELRETFDRVMTSSHEKYQMSESRAFDSLVERSKEYKIELENLLITDRKLKNMTIFDSDIVKDQDYAGYIKNLERAKSILGDIRNMDQSGDYAGIDKLYKELDDLVIKINAFSKAKQNANAAVLSDNKEIDKLNKLGQSLTRYLNDYETRLKRFPDLYSQFIELQRKLNNNEIISADAARELNRIQMEARAAGVEVDTLWRKLKKAFMANMRGQLANMGWMAITTSFRQVYQNVLQLDTAMTELKKVTNETEDAYIQFLDNAEKRAKKFGATLVDVVSVSADWSRLGYSMSDSEVLADATLLYLNIADGVDDATQASEVLISTLQGMGYAVEDVMKIVDSFNEVSNRFGSSAGDIGEIVKRSAAAMKVAGSSLEEVIALGVVSNEVVQDSATVGTAMKTMSMRLRSSKSDLEAAGEDTDGMAESVSKLRDEIMALSGVDIMLDDSTYKTPYQMLMEIGEVWDSLTDISRANIGELLFGKRQTLTCLGAWKHAS